MRMHYVLACAVALSAAASAATLHAQRGAPLPEKATSKAAQDLIAHAMAIAKDDLKSEAADACLPGGPARDPDPRPMQTVEPLKVFDNLYYVGPGYVSVWLLTTPDGSILFDTAQEPYVDYVIGNVWTVGVDPKSIATSS